LQRTSGSTSGKRRDFCRLRPALLVAVADAKGTSS
jgi:hypothetical protein